MPTDIDAPQEGLNGGWTRLQWAALTDDAREVRAPLAQGAKREATAAAIAGTVCVMVTLTLTPLVFAVLSLSGA